MLKATLQNDITFKNIYYHQVIGNNLDEVKSTEIARQKQKHNKRRTLYYSTLMQDREKT